MYIEFKKSALTRDISEANIRHAFLNPNYDGPIEEDGLDNRYLRLGFEMKEKTKTMERMTEEEAFALDEYYTNNPPKVDQSKARIRIPMVRVDNITAEYLVKEAKTSHRKPEDIINNLVLEKLSQS